MMGGVKINLPKTSGNPMPRPQNPIIVSLDAESRVFVDKEEVPSPGRSAVFRKMALESESGEIFVRGDGEVKYSRMMELMSELGQAGFARVTLVTSVQPTSGPAETPAADPGSAAATAPAAPTPSLDPAAAAAPVAPLAPATPPAPAPPAPAN
jgi:biopolymer transport protein ExbD